MQPAQETHSDTRLLIRRALAGENLTVDSLTHSLHEMTQLAVALQPGAALAIRHAGFLSPLERASIETVGKGRVVFF